MTKNSKSKYLKQRYGIDGQKFREKTITNG